MVHCRTCHQSDTILHNLSHHYSVAKFPCAWYCITVILFEIRFNRLHSFSAIKVTLVNAWGLHSTFQPSICHACDQIWFLGSSGYGWDQFQFEDLSTEFAFSPVCISRNTYLTYFPWINHCFSDPTYSWACLFENTSFDVVMVWH
jgi:hypothetical protein